MKKIIYSIGHSNRAFSEFLSKLQENKIDTVIDIRTFPRSRFCPHFNEKRLATALQEQNVTYLFRGHNLGGKGENTGYEEAIGELVEMVQNKKNVCVVCSEGDYKQCHRHSMLEPSFNDRGVEVIHIVYDK